MIIKNNKKVNLKMGYIRYFYFYILHFFIVLYNKFFCYKEQKVESIANKIELFIKNNKKRFLETFEETEYKNYLYNSNIDECFYFKEKYAEMIEEVDNDIEKKWKTRIMFKNTPYGNVIMFYDVYKNGFAYYSDVHLTYPLLNALAMNYVITYQCRDLFFDEITLPNNNREMKILKIIQEIEKENEKKTKKKGKEEDFKNIYRNKINEQKKNNDLPLVKFKKYNIPKKEEIIFQTNKFIYLGKIINFQFLKKIPIKKTQKIIENIENNNKLDINLQNNQELSWQQYKKLKNN